MTFPRIGLLGGSFNPAHAGHLHITLEAMKRLNLDQVWWLVTPQNPLKSEDGMAPYAERFASALEITQGKRRILVSDFEQKMGLHYTFETIRAIKKRYPKTHFVWIMGADNLAGFHRWQHWRDIARMVAIAVFDRAPFSHSALHAKAAITLRSSRLKDSEVNLLAMRTGWWAYLLMRRHGASSTEIRARRKEAAIKN